MWHTLGFKAAFIKTIWTSNCRHQVFCISHDILILLEISNITWLDTGYHLTLAKHIHVSWARNLSIQTVVVFYMHLLYKISIKFHRTSLILLSYPMNLFFTSLKYHLMFYRIIWFIIVVSVFYNFLYFELISSRCVFYQTIHSYKQRLLLDSFSCCRIIIISRYETWYLRAKM